MRCAEVVPTPRNMNLTLQTRMVNADPRVGRSRVLWVWTWIHFGASSGTAAPGISALMECRMPKFLLQTSAFLWLKHQSDYIQHFPACHIQPRQTVQHFSQHPCSTGSWYPILFTPWLIGLLYCLDLPFYVLLTGTDTADLNQSTFSSTHHPSPWQVTKTFRQSVEEQDKLTANTSLFPFPSFQPASAASPCSAERLCLQPWPWPASLPVSSSLWPGAGQPHRVKQDIVQEVLHRKSWVTRPSKALNSDTYSWALPSCASLPGTLNTRQDISYDKKNSD